MLSSLDKTKQDRKKLLKMKRNLLRIRETEKNVEASVGETRGKHKLVVYFSDNSQFREWMTEVRLG